MTPHREWFSEYEKYDGSDVFLGDDSIEKIMGRGSIKLLLKYGRIRNKQVLHIIFVIPMIVNDVNLSIAFRGVTVA
jgi:hypothetical protein